MRVAGASLSLKRNHRFRHENLFTPYCIESHRPNTQRSDSNKTFFKTMKDELFDIKTHVEQFIKTNREQQTICETEHCRTIKLKQTAHSDSKRVQNIENMQLAQNSINNNKIFNSLINTNQLKFSKHLKQQQKQLTKQTKQTKIQKTIITELKTQNLALHTQLESMKQLSINYQQQINEIKQKLNRILLRNKQLEKQSYELYQYKILFEDSINILNEEVNNLSRRFKIRDKEVNELNLSNKCLSEQLEELQREILLKNAEISDIISQKTQHEQLLITKYNSLRQKYQLEIQKLENEIENQQRTVEELKHCNSELLCIQKIHRQSAVNTKYLRFDTNHEHMKLLGAEFEQKINQYIDENVQLKNQINHLKAENQQLKTQKQCMKDTIQAYETREQIITCHIDHIQQQCFHREQQQKLQQQINTLKEQGQKLSENYELKIMKLENQIDDLKWIKNSQAKTDYNLNKIIKDQLYEREELQNNFRAMKKQLQILKLKQSRKQIDYPDQQVENNPTKRRVSERNDQNLNLQQQTLVRKNEMLCFDN